MNNQRHFLATIENELGLHKHLSCTYLVGSYSARIVDDNDNVIKEAAANTLYAAMNHLAYKIRKENIKT